MSNADLPDLYNVPASCAWLYLLVVALLGALPLLPAPVFASQYACYEQVGESAGARPFDDPCPEPDDIRLPMPGDLHMVFRAIPVPGGEFWGNPARNVQLGDPDARIFEGPRMVTVSGSFPSADGEAWNIVLGKYEVSVAQMAVVFGAGDLDAGIEVLASKSLYGEELRQALSTDISVHAKRRLLAAPARGLTLADLHLFVSEYTRWCYANQVCIEAMPSFGSLPAFFRLPTEIEWEFAARQHDGSDNRISALPFEHKDTKDYAYLSSAIRIREGPTPIGRFNPTAFGVHDLYGNVAELLDGRFLAELGQGKPGMRVSRGGSYALNIQSQKLRPSNRSEVQEWRFDDANALVPVRDARLGIRLALGSHTVPDIATLDSLEESYFEYRSNDRLSSSSGRSTQANVLNIVEPLNEIDALVLELSKAGILPLSGREKILQYTNSARDDIKKTSEALSVELIKKAYNLVAESGRNLHRIRQKEKIIDVLSASSSARASKGVKDAEKVIEDIRQEFNENIATYKNTVFRLAGYRDFAANNLASLASGSQSDLLAKSFELVSEHTNEVLAGSTDVDSWETDIVNAFSDDGLFIRK